MSSRHIQRGDVSCRQDITDLTTHSLIIGFDRKRPDQGRGIIGVEGGREVCRSRSRCGTQNLSKDRPLCTVWIFPNWLLLLLNKNLFTYRSLWLFPTVPWIPDRSCSSVMMGSWLLRSPYLWLLFQTSRDCVTSPRSVVLVIEMCLWQF